jgi:antitoxin (DNA-binding transcriptional repressor) of toxin-antitoxin stability system
METVSKSYLKAHMLEVFRRLEAEGETLIVTDRGRPVLRISPFARSERVESVFADVRGRGFLPADAELEAPMLDVWAAHMPEAAGAFAGGDEELP